MTTATASPHRTATTSLAQRTAVTSLVLWGLLHLVGGVVLVAAATGSAEDAMVAYATALTTGPVDAATADAITGLVGFHGFNIAAAGVAVAVLAWRSRGRDGSLTTPLVVASIADVGLIAFLLVPGVMAAADGAPGVVLLAVALAAAWRAGTRPGSRAA